MCGEIETRVVSNAQYVVCIGLFAKELAVQMATRVRR